MKSIAVIYWSGGGNTEKMSEKVAKGAKTEETTVTLQRVESFNVEKIAEYHALALGCPAMGNEVLEEDTMEPFVQVLEKLGLQEIPLALFGSYDWGGGQWMRDWEERMKKAGAKLVAAGLNVSGAPDDLALTECEELGKRLASAVTR